MLRVKNEARSLPWVLPPLLRATQGVVLVDNQSDDGTPDVATQVAREHGFEDKMRGSSYPFDVSRCGPEHLGTPPTRCTASSTSTTGPSPTWRPPTR